MTEPDPMSRYELNQVQKLAEDAGLVLNYRPDLHGSRGGAYGIDTPEGKCIASAATLDEAAGFIQGALWALDGREPECCASPPVVCLNCDQQS